MTTLAVALLLPELFIKVTILYASCAKCIYALLYLCREIYPKWFRADSADVAADWAANIAAVARETFSEAALLAGKSLGCSVGMYPFFVQIDLNNFRRYVRFNS